MFVLDTHCDTPSEILNSARNLSLDNINVHVDLPKIKRGGVDAAFFALYIPVNFDSEPDKAYEYALQMYDKLALSIDENSDLAAFASSKDQALKNKKEGKFSVFLGLENASPLGESLERLNFFHELGIRYITLCHTGNNLVCDSCASDLKRWNGLSPFGRELVGQMNSLGMLIDVSHISDDAFYDVIEYSSKPVVATHSCCRALAEHPRNMSDDMIKALAAAGGVIHINFYPLFLDGTLENISSYQRIVDHIDHVVNLVGIDHVGLGSDFDGIEVTPVGLEDISMFPKIFHELSSRGYSKEDISKIASENLFRIL